VQFLCLGRCIEDFPNTIHIMDPSWVSVAGKDSWMDWKMLTTVFIGTWTLWR